MKTSSFKTYKGNNGIAICIYPPLDWTGDRFYSLNPDRETFFAKKADQIDEAQYEKQYRERVLSKLDPQKTYDALRDKVLLCWEDPGLFCHRRIVAEWLQENLGVEVPEWKKDDEIKTNSKPLF